jgi:hypothetical protein
MTMKQAVADLKAGLIDLDATGEDGFEGLVGVVLGRITGHQFRLAGAGSQHGKDGESVSSTTHITFEGKLYATDIPKNEVLSKATEIIVQEWLATYLELARQADWDGEAVPAYVEREFRRFLECGILACGFARAYCDAGGHDFRIAFSCKGASASDLTHCPSAHEH